MDEKHKIGKDGWLEDGVSYYPVDTHAMQAFEDAKRELSRFSAPVLVHANNPHERLYVAAFDGTGNDALRDPEHATNVYRINDQIEQLKKSANRQIGVGYVPGPGTQDNLIDRTWDGIRGYTYDPRLEEMYSKFIKQAKEWRNEDPNVQIRIADIGFSRGAEQAAGFARLVHERGIQDASGAHYSYDSRDQITHVTYSKPAIVAPGQIAQVVGLFDPVGTGVPVNDKDRRLPPSVISGFQLIAKDEHRGQFKSSHIIDPGLTPDGRFLGVTIDGAHSDIGGSYHRDGLGIRSGNLMIDYLNALSDQPYLGKTAEPDDPRRNVVHRSEEGMLVYRVGKKIDRQQPAGYEERLVPKDQVNNVPDAYNAEPRDEALNQQFERHNVLIGAVPAPRPAQQHDAPPISLQTDLPPAQTLRAILTSQAHTQGPPAAFQPVLRRDDRGEEVGALQQQLRHLGYTGARGRPLAIDGHFGPATHAAVQAFQHEQGLAVDGVVDPPTWEALHRQTQSPSRPRHAPVVEPQHPVPVTAPPATQASVMSSQPQIDEAARIARQAVIDQHIAHLQRMAAEEKEAAQRAADAHTAPAHDTALWTSEPLPPPRVPSTFADPDHPKHYRYQTLLEQVKDAPALQRYTDDQHARIAAGLTYVTDQRGEFIIQDLRAIEVQGNDLIVTDRLKIGQASNVVHGNLSFILSKTPEETASAWREWALPKQSALAVTSQTMASVDPHPVSRTDMRHPQEPHHAMFLEARRKLGATYAHHGMTRDPEQLDREAARVTMTLRERQMTEVPTLRLACEPDGRFSTQPGLRAVSDFNMVKFSGEDLQQAPAVEQSSQTLVQVEQRLHEQALAHQQQWAQQAGLGRTR